LRSLHLYLVALHLDRLLRFQNSCAGIPASSRIDRLSPLVQIRLMGRAHCSYHDESSCTLINTVECPSPNRHCSRDLPSARLSCSLHPSLATVLYPRSSLTLSSHNNSTYPSVSVMFSVSSANSPSITLPTGKVVCQAIPL
jgi:hypothetical protein